MKHWLFDDEDFEIITKLMANKLLAMPDNTYISVSELLIQALEGERVYWEDDYGYNNGIKISDVITPNGQYLHELIDWDFENGVWHCDYEQGFALMESFANQPELKKFFIDETWSAGMKLGLLWNIPSYYRNIKNLLKAFSEQPTTQVLGLNNKPYYVSKLELSHHFHYEQENRDHTEIKDFDKITEIQLFRLPKGVTTEKIFIDEYASVHCVKGRCKCDSLSWEYVNIFIQGLRWYDNAETHKMGCGQTEYFEPSSSHYEHRPVTEKRRAWFSLTNTGNSELLLFVEFRQNTRVENEETKIIPL